jgi:large subunit ribosomal protein L17
MKKRVFGRKFKRDVNERKALFKSLMSELVLHGRIRTTEQKAKAIRSSAEKLIKKAQKDVNLARKLLSSELIPQAIEKLIKDVAPKLAARAGGYTRLIKVGRRFNDDASMVIMEWVEYSQTATAKNDKSGKKEMAEKQTVSEEEIVEAEIISEKPKKEKTVTKTKPKAEAKKVSKKKAK